MISPLRFISISDHWKSLALAAWETISWKVKGKIPAVDVVDVVEDAAGDKIVVEEEEAWF